ncbi:MAG TPA: hypothetical protein VLJ37_07420 [bacterium]|nr:hypothetical protein [bacterium]
MSSPQSISGTSPQFPQDLSANGETIEPMGQAGVADPEPLPAAPILSGASSALSSLEQNMEPAGAWNRNANRFGDAAQFLGRPRPQPSSFAAALTDEVLDEIIPDLSLVAADDPSVDLAEIDAARERLLNNPNTLPVLSEMDLEDAATLLGIAEPLAAVNLAALRGDCEIRQVALAALGDRQAALQRGDYEEVSRIEEARSALRQDPRAGTALPVIIASGAPGAADLAASIVIQHPETLRRLEEILTDEDVAESARAGGIGALPRIAREVPELHENIREFLGDLQRTDGDSATRARALTVHHRLGFSNYGEAVALVSSLEWTLCNDPDPDLRIDAAYHLAQVAREVSSGTSYPDSYPVELERSDGEALIRHIREDILEEELRNAALSEVSAAIDESLESLR